MDRDIYAQIIAKIKDIGEKINAMAENVPVGGAGYCKLPDGTLICYGTAEITSYEKSVTFAMEFASAPSVCAMPNSVNNMLQVTEITTTGFKVGRTTSGDAYSYPWIAVGKWEQGG